MIGDLEVEALLGQGTAAAIYRVRHDVFGVAALKVAHSTDETIARRIIMEGEVLQQIDHPNVVRIYEARMVADRPSLLMEYIEGPTMASWLDIYGRPKVHEALELFKGLCRGVQAVHAVGLIHRDLNPNNVLLAMTEHKRVVPKLVDFGLVRPSERRTSSRTATGPLGTLSYMAPEQMENARLADHRADLYALGCILYELTTGGQAFVGGLRVIQRKAAAADYIGPAVRRPDLPPEIERVIRRLLAPDAEARYASIEALMRDLYQATVPPIGLRDSGAFQHWSVGGVSTAASTVLRRISPRVGESDGVDEADARATRQHRAEQIGIVLGAVVMLCALVGTVLLVSRWL